MTNKEWLNSLSDNKFASWLSNEFSLTYEEFFDLLMWLSEEHTKSCGEENE